MSKIKYATIDTLYADRRARPNPYADGYGSKIPTRYWVSVAEGASRRRRVWAMSYGNAASLYVIVKGEVLFLNDTELATRVPFHTYD